ncbi:MAG TPA: glutathione peroxidase [Novosphingobium sp.]
MADPRTLADFSARLPGGRTLDLADYAGKVVLVVNTASRCGFTPQYAGLEALWQAYRDRGFAILAFPCNQFGHQEPGDADEIASFCQVNYGLSFPVMDKIAVNGAEASDLYRWLKDQAPGVLGTRAIKWNFTKFLIDRSGKVAGRFGPLTTPDQLRSAIEALL